MTKILKTIALTLATLAFLGCNSDLFNIDVNFTYSTDIPIAFSDVETFSEEADFDFAEQPELKEYLQKIKDVTINSLKVTVPKYEGGENCIFDLVIKFDDVVLYEGKDIDVKGMNADGSSVIIKDATVLNEASKQMLENKKGYVSATATSQQGAVSASFTAHCDLDMTVTVNPTTPAK